MSKGSAEALLRVDNLVKHYPITKGGIIRQKQVGAVRAVDGISFEVREGETLGLVERAGAVSPPQGACSCALRSLQKDQSVLNATIGLQWGEE